METFAQFAGIDWGSRLHEVCVLGPDGKKLKSFTAEHTTAGLEHLTHGLELLAREGPERMAVAIEVPRGPIVELLLERGFSVFHINPKQLDRFRDRHTVAGAKDDRRDAYVLADSLRTDLKLFHPLQLDHPLIIQLRAATRLHHELDVTLGQAANRLREELYRTMPALLALSPGANNPWLWELLSLAPTAQQLQDLTLDEVTLLVKRRKLRKLKGGDLYNVLQNARLRVAPGVAEAAGLHITALVSQLILVQAQRRDAERQVERLLELLAQANEAGEWGEHRDVAIVLSLPGIGTILGGTVLAETSQALAERDYHALRTQFGVAPVTVKSGRKEVKKMRRAVAGRLRRAAFCWGQLAIQKDPRSKAHYDRLRAKDENGNTRCSHARALRGVIDRLLGVLVAMLTTQTTYNADLRRDLAA